MLPALSSGDAELVALRVGERDPLVRALLLAPQLGRTQADQPGDLLLPPVGTHVHVEVLPVLVVGRPRPLPPRGRGACPPGPTPAAGPTARPPPGRSPGRPPPPAGRDPRARRGAAGS